MAEIPAGREAYVDIEMVNGKHYFYSGQGTFRSIVNELGSLELKSTQLVKVIDEQKAVTYINLKNMVTVKIVLHKDADEDILNTLNKI